MKKEILFLLFLLLFIFFIYILTPNEDDDDSLKKDYIVVSLTTSPRRIKLMEEVIKSILNQTHPPDKIRINIPKKFKRSGETFNEIPNFLLNNDKIEIKEYDEDMGPIMKFLPTFYDYKNKKNTHIIYTDDDVLLLPKTIEVFLKKIKEDANKIYCFSGYNVSYDDNGKFKIFNAVDKGEVHLAEGYMSVCINKNILKKLDDGELKLMDYYKNYIKKDTYAFTSDDLMLSNFYSLKKIKKIKLYEDDVNFDKWWSSGCELQYGNAGDGIKHLYENEHWLSYQKSFEFLTKNNLFSLI